MIDNEVALRRIPFDRIEAVLLDVGGTLVSIDFALVQRELLSRGVHCTPAALERAEAAARPGYSREMSARLRQREPPLRLEHFLTGCFRCLGAGVEAAALAAELSPILQRPGESYMLWRSVLPGVSDALADFAAMGMRLAVVSNSDGSVEKSLAMQGLRRHLELVVDSAIVGVEKPDAAIFVHALDALGCAPERALHVGDMYFADVEGARSAGIHAILLDPYDDWRDVDCARLPSLAAVRDRFRRALGEGAGR